MLVQILGALRRSVLFDVIGRTVDMHLDADQMALDEIRLARRRHANRDIGLAHRQIEFRIVDHQADLDLRVEFEEFPDPRRQPDRAERDVGGDL